MSLQKVSAPLLCAGCGYRASVQLRWDVIHSEARISLLAVQAVLNLCYGFASDRINVSLTELSLQRLPVYRIKCQSDATFSFALRQWGLIQRRRKSVTFHQLSVYRI